MSYHIDPAVELQPIYAVLKDIPFIIEGIAPERLSQLEVDLNNLDFDVIDCHKAAAKIYLNNNLVLISSGLAECLWCFSYSFFVLYNNVFAGKAWPGQKIDLESTPLVNDPEIQTAKCLYVYAIKRWNGDLMQWPQFLPKPQMQPSQNSAIEVANELTRVALAFVLHHEIAHHKLQHYDGTESEKLEQEKDADLESANFILSNIDDEKIKFKRGVGIAIATLAMLAKSDTRHINKLTTHPRAFERIVNSLSPHFDAENDQMWGFIASIIMIYIKEIKNPETEYENFYDAVQAACNTLADKS